MRILQYTTIIIVAVLLRNVQWTYGKKPTSYVIFNEVHTYFHPDYIDTYVVKIQPSAPGPALNMNMHVKRNFTLDPMVQINVSKAESNSVYRNILAFNIDLCRIFGAFEKPKNIMDVGGMMDSWWINIRKYGDIPTCPVHEGNYELRNFSYDRRNIPLFILPAKYRIELAFFLRNTNPKLFFNNCTLVIDVKNK